MKLYTEIIALCDYATISKEGKLSINGIFDELRVQNLPGGITRAFLVATVHGLPEESYKLTIKIERDDNSGKSSLQPLHIEIHTSPNAKNNLIVELINVGFDKEGDYHFRIYHGDDEVGSTILKVIHLKQARQETFKMPN